MYEYLLRAYIHIGLHRMSHLQALIAVLFCLQPQRTPDVQPAPAQMQLVDSPGLYKSTSNQYLFQ